MAWECANRCSLGAKMVLRADCSNVKGRERLSWTIWRQRRQRGKPAQENRRIEVRARLCGCFRAHCIECASATPSNGVARAKPRPSLTKRFIGLRFNWADKMLTKAARFWRKTLFMEEKRSTLDGPNWMACYGRDKRLTPTIFSTRARGVVGWSFGREARGGEDAIEICVRDDWRVGVHYDAGVNTIAVYRGTLPSRPNISTERRAGLQSKVHNGLFIQYWHPYVAFGPLFIRHGCYWELLGALNAGCL